jgi:hypothetical protein
MALKSNDMQLKRECGVILEGLRVSFFSRYYSGLFDKVNLNLLYNGLIGFSNTLRLVSCTSRAKAGRKQHKCT